MRSIFDLLLFLVLVFGPLTHAFAQPRAAPKPTPNSAEEPKAEKMSLVRTAEFLDGAAQAWLNSKKCASCHTTYPYVLARSLLGDDAPAFVQMRDYLRDRVANWDEGGKGVGLFEGTEGVTEVVAIAATLAFEDARATGKLHASTRKALERMWELQEKNGAWTWNKHLLPPQEYDDYYGAVYAALGVGHAPEKYAQSEAARVGVARLRDYFQKTPAPNLHHRTLLLWASTKLDGLMTPVERDQTVKQLRALQRKDGGWNLPSLADWKRLNGDANDKDAPSDGYATGLVLYVLRQTGVAKEDDAIRRGVKWLESNQRVSGRWFTRSVNADRAHYNTVAGTAYAVMALKACAIERPTSINYPSARNLNLKIALSPDGKLVAAIDFHGVIKVFDTASAKEITNLPGHKEWPEFIRFSPDGKQLAAPAGIIVQSNRPVIKLWDTTKWTLEKTVPEHPWKERDNLSIEPKFWDISLGRKVRGLNAGKEYLPSIIASSPDGKLLAVAEHFLQGDQPITPHHFVWGKVDGKPWANNVRGVDGMIEALAWNPDNMTVVSMGLDKVWKDSGPGQPKELARFEGKINVWQAKIDRGPDRAAKIIAPATYEGSGLDVQFSSDGKMLITCSSHDGAVFWNAADVWKTGKVKKIAQFPDRRPAGSTGMAISADSTTLAVANTSNAIQIWDVRGILKATESSSRIE